MAANPQKNNSQELGNTLIQVVQNTLRTACNLEFSQDPKQSQRNIIEYESRMRTLGLEKFNGPCLVSSINFYKNQNDANAHNPFGTMNLFLEEDSSIKILKTLGNPSFNENDDTILLEICGEFCKMLSGNLKNELSNLGFNESVLSAPVNQKNDITSGVEFPYSQLTCLEVEFFIYKQKAIVINLVIAPN